MNLRTIAGPGAALVAAGPLLGQSIVVRGPARDVPTGQPAAVTPAGVLVTGGAGQEAALVGWQRVREVTGPLGLIAAPYAPFSDALWRAQQRVARGDYVLAETLAEPLYERQAGEGVLAGPSGALLSEIVLRCRLARASSSGATWAYLDLVDVVIRGRGSAATPGEGAVRWVGWSSGEVATSDARWAGEAALDQDSLLSPWLPPMFSARLAGRALPAFVDAPSWARWARAGGTVADLAVLYRYAAQGEMTLAGDARAVLPPVPAVQSQNAGVALVRLVVLARFGTPEERGAARKALQARAGEELRRAASDAVLNPDGEGSGGLEEVRWVEAWCRLAIGRSLLREGAPAQRRLGVIELLHLPARFSAQLPSLAALALAEAAAELERAGDATGAEALWAQVRAEHPGYADQAP